METRARHAVTVRLFHFSDDPGIDRFVPRPVRVAAPRAPGNEWLNGPLVWAIDDWHQPMYLFPRDCPRILLWATPATSAADHRDYFENSAARMLAYVESRWLDVVRRTVLHRYELPPDPFRSLNDAGMWVSTTPVRPMQRLAIEDLPARLKAAGVELRALDDLTPLKGVWNTSLHASGIRLRNAAGWNDDA